MKKLILALLVIIIVVGAVACARSESTSEGGGSYDSALTVPQVNSSSGTSVESPPVTVELKGYESLSSEPSPGDLTDDDRLIIRTGSLVLVVEDVGEAIDKIASIAGLYNGYVVASNSWQEDDRMAGNIAIRVEVAYFEQAMLDLSDLAVEVSSESTSGEDVTEEYVDLDAQLRNLEASEAQLLELMQQAGDVSEILEVQRELVDTREEIERIKGRMQYLEDSAAMSYIAVNLEQSKLTVEFIAASRNVKTGESVHFTPIVAGGFEPYSYAWDFGDGDTSTEANPTHTYSDNGSYTVSLVVTDDRSNTESYEREDYVTVAPGWSAGSIASSAWKGLAAFFRVMGTIFIWLGIFSPVWIVILLILYFAWWRHRKKAK